MNEERIKELFSDEEYVKGLFELGSYEKASEKLAEDGVDISAEDLKKALALAGKKIDGELSDEELDEVAGGNPIIIGAAIVFALLFSAVEGVNIANKKGC